MITEKDVCIVKNGQTVTQKYQVGNMIIDKLCFKDYEYNNVAVPVIDLNYVESQLKTFDNSIELLGTLGMDFLLKHLVTINYKENYMIIDSVDKIERKKYHLEFSSNKHPLVEVKIDDVPYTFILDTGASNCACDKNYIERFTKEFVVNESNCFIAKRLNVFDVDFLDLVMVGLDMTKMSNEEPIVGIVGYPCVKNSILTFDCGNNLLYYSV